MQKTSKIYVAGHTGMVGSALIRELTRRGFLNLVIRSSKDLDLTKQNEVDDFFKFERPEYVFLAAAKVGGLLANNTYRADFITINLQIQTNLISAAWKHDVKKLLFMASSCIYPRECQQPMNEEHLWSGSLEPTNLPYAVAKLAGVEMCRAFHDQFGSRFISVIPSNLYGQNDNYHPENSHLMAALISKIHNAKIKNHPKVILWGTGTPRRELLYVDDLANASCMLMEKYEDPSPINIGWGSDHSIREIAFTVRSVIGYDGELEFDISKPDGMPRKLLECSKIMALGWRPETQLSFGVEKTFNHYLNFNLNRTYLGA